MMVLRFFKVLKSENFSAILVNGLISIFFMGWDVPLGEFNEASYWKIYLQISPAGQILFPDLFHPCRL